MLCRRRLLCPSLLVTITYQRPFQRRHGHRAEFKCSQHLFFRSIKLSKQTRKIRILLYQQQATAPVAAAPIAGTVFGALASAKQTLLIHLAYSSAFFFVRTEISLSNLLTPLNDEGKHAFQGLRGDCAAKSSAVATAAQQIVHV